MKLLFKSILSLFAVIFFMAADAQDPTIQVLTGNNGVVGVGETVFLEVKVGNTLSNPVPANKIRVSVSAPASVTLNSAQTLLPAGFVICSNSGGTMIISNGSTPITQSLPQTIQVAMVGNYIAPIQTVSGSILFAGGTVATRCNNGAPIPTNTLPNDNGTSTIIVAAPTPITLSRFTASLVNCQPFLNWETEYEINSRHFVIERSNPGNSTWQSIAEIAANGSATAKTKYNFTDRNLVAESQNVLYRLKMIDKNGEFKYSEVVPVSVNCKTTQVSVFHNPVRNGKVNVILSGATGITEAVLMSAAGQQVLKTKIINGINYLNVSNISDGVYYLHIKEANGADKKVKLLIQK